MTTSVARIRLVGMRVRARASILRAATSQELVPKFGFIWLLGVYSVHVQNRSLDEKHFPVVAQVICGTSNALEG